MTDYASLVATRAELWSKAKDLTREIKHLRYRATHRMQRGRRRKAVSVSDVIDAYLDGASLRAIAIRFGVCDQTITRRLHEAGVVLRAAHRPKALPAMTAAQKKIYRKMRAGGMSRDNAIREALL